MATLALALFIAMSRAVPVLLTGELGSGNYPCEALKGGNGTVAVTAIDMDAHVTVGLPPPLS